MYSREAEYRRCYIGTSIHKMIGKSVGGDVATKRMTTVYVELRIILHKMTRTILASVQKVESTRVIKKFLA